MVLVFVVLWPLTSFLYPTSYIPPPSSILPSIRPRILNLHNQDILRPDLYQLIHRRRHLLPLHHRLNRHPLRLHQTRNRRRPLARCDDHRLVEITSLHVVGAQDVALRCDDTTDACGYEGDERGVGWGGGLAGLDEDSSGGDDGFDGVETASAHCFAGL